MALTVTEAERRALEAAQAKSRAVRHWRPYQAVLLRVNGLAGAEAHRALGGTETGGGNWTAACRGCEGRGRVAPPLRGGWARRGQQQVVVLSGRNTRRVVHGALNAATGDLVTLIRERSRQDDCLAFVQALGQVRPQVPKLLIWDNAPPHHPKRVQAAAAAAQITIAFLPFRAPELMPCEDLWRLTKRVVAANRAYGAVQEQAERAVAWLTALTPFDRLLKSGLFGAKFQWLST